MKSFYIKYKFAGVGECLVDAVNEKQAREKFEEGTDCSWGDDEYDYTEITNILPETTCECNLDVKKV